MDAGIVQLVVIPFGLGLLGFIEPCSVGSTLLFLKYLEGKPTSARLMQTVVFTVTRMLFIGALGMLAVLIGSAFVGLQKGAWVVLGSVYVLVGLAYIFRRVGWMNVSVGPNLHRLSGVRGSVALGLLFGLNIPACAAPLVFALLGMAAARGVGSDTLTAGFVSLASFGLALSLPIVAAVLIAPGRRLLDRLAGWSGQWPIWTGLLLVALGLWSIGFGLLAEVKA